MSQLDKENLKSKLPISRVLFAGLVVVVIAGIALIAMQMRQQPTSPVATTSSTPTATTSPAASTSTPTTTSPTPTPTAPSTFTPASTKGIIAVVYSDKSTDQRKYSYFDPAKKEVIATYEPAKETDGGGSVYDNEDVQFDSNGNSYVMKNAEGGMGGCPEDKCYTQIKKYPAGDVVVHVDDLVTSQWLVTKDGSQIYLALPKTADSGQDDLWVIDPVTKAKTLIASIGTISAPLVISADEKTIYVGESRERLEGNLHYRDAYLKTVVLATKAVSEKLIYKEPTLASYDSIDQFVFGPNMRKAITHVEPFTKSTARVIAINLSDATTQDILFYEELGSTSGVSWSPDGMKVAFDVLNVSDSVSKKQGIWVYDFNTGQNTQLLTSNITDGNNGAKGQKILMKNSFDGSSFVYALDGTIFYFDIATKKSYKIAEDRALGDVYVHRF